MFILDDFVSSIDYILNSRRKRHLIGGVMLSLSLLFGGLSATIFTLKDGANNE